MSKKQQVMETPPNCVLLVNTCCTGCVKKINKLFDKIDRKHATRTSITPQLEQGKTLVIVTGNIDKAILFKKLKTIDKIPRLINPIHKDEGSSSTSSEVQQPNPTKNNKDNENAALVIEKKAEKEADSEKKEEKNRGREIEEMKNMGQEEQLAPRGPMNSHLAGQMGGYPTGQMIYGHPMGDRFGHPQIPQQRRHFSSIFDDDNPNGCSIM